MKKNLLIIPFVVALAIATVPASAQVMDQQSVEEGVTKLASSEGVNPYETLSGINLFANRKGTYDLLLQQELKENGVLEVINSTGKTVYKKPIKLKKGQQSWRYDLGKLKSDTYDIQVKSANTTYWSKFKVSR